MIVLFFSVCFLACVAGSICGIGGGVIIKPVLDATGVMSVSGVSFLSGCTVLAMSVVSVYKNLKAGQTKLNIRIATALAVGGALGGLAGKVMFQELKDAVGNENLVGLVQALVLIAVTVGTLAYTIFKEKISARHYESLLLCFIIGAFLGIISSFLGLGGGPMNLVVLGYFFSLRTKEAALCSLYIILFSQIASLVQTVATGTVPQVPVPYFLVMVCGGILGGMLGSRINKKIPEEKVNRLFILLLTVVVLINIYNVIKFAG